MSPFHSGSAAYECPKCKQTFDAKSEWRAYQTHLMEHLVSQL